MEKRKVQVWLPLLFGLVMALGLLAGFQLAGSSGRFNPSATSGKRSGVQEVLDLIQYRYVDSIAVDSIQTAGIEAMLQELDPHSVFISRQQLADVNADLQGGFSGIGVEYQMINDTLNVVYVIENGPSAKAGLKSGDQLIKVYDEVIAGKNLKGNDLRKLLRGNYKTRVSVTYLRNGKLGTVEITRGNVPLPSVDASYMITKTTGYLRLNRFSETTYKEFMEAATQLQQQGMKKLILDLRGNGGGILQEATNIADELLEDGLPIVSTRGQHVKNKAISSNKPGIFEEGPLVVLIDEFSASASEVVAGALQDNDRGTIMGRRSFGKGLVQEQYDLSNGGALRITVARYYTPSGRSIQKPYNGNRHDYMSEAYERGGAPDSADPTATPSREVYTTRKGKKVMGGGGITPDVVLASDTSKLPADAATAINNNLIGDVSFLLFKQYEPQIKALGDAANFEKKFVLPSQTWDNYLAAASKDSLSMPRQIPPQVKQVILQRIKANMARYIWRGNGFFTVLNANDNTLKSALEHIEKQ
jgi:carboxyl-terminal processing protease